MDSLSKGQLVLGPSALIFATASLIVLSNLLGLLPYARPATAHFLITLRLGGAF